MTSKQGVTKAFGSMFKIAGVAILGTGLFLGGCNNKLKEENEALAKEAAELREAKTAAETQKAALEQRMVTLQTENRTLNERVQMQTQQPAYPVAGASDFNDTGRSGRSGRSSGSQRTIEISGDVLFGSGSATLKSDAKRELDRVVSDLRNAEQIIIEGHTDSDPVRKSRYGSNQALSKARADAVRDYLSSKGVSKSRISTVGKGSSEPRETKAKSRRVDIVVVD